MPLVCGCSTACGTALYVAWEKGSGSEGGLMVTWGAPVRGSGCARADVAALIIIVIVNRLHDTTICSWRSQEKG